MPSPTLKEELSPSELMTASLIAWGWSAKEIARAFGRTHRGVRAQLNNIYIKTGTSDKLELATRYAWEIMEADASDQSQRRNS